MSNVLRSSDDERGHFFADTLEAGVEALQTGYVAIPSEDVTKTWHYIWKLAQTEHPQLKMKAPGSKPGRSTWIYFREAEGLIHSEERSISLVLKAERGQADLMFGRTELAEMQGIAMLLEPDMKVAKASNSASIRIEVPTIDFAADGDSQTEAIKTGLAACERLRKFVVGCPELVRDLPNKNKS